MMHTIQMKFTGLLCLLLLVPALAWGQTRTVTGVVKDASGETIIGANVLEKGTANGVITNVDGRFSISVPQQAVLTVSYVGYISQEITVGGRSQLTVTLVEDSRMTEEVVVIGYGTARRSDVTGSIASVANATIKEVPAASISNSLQGRVAGVDMSQTSTKPGSDMQIRIRGTRSLNADNNPLIVLDGIPFMGNLSDVNPTDIKSVDILKDASATAIYGSRGANGVILVTTNKGTAGQKATVSYNGYYGVKNIFSKYPMMDGQKFVAYRKEAIRNGSPYANTPDENDGVNTDWQDLVFQSGMVTSHDLGVSGGGVKSAYNFGAGYYDETTVIPGQEFSRLSMRGSFDQEISIFKFGVSSQTSYGIIDGSTNNPMYNVLTLTPLTSPYDSNGKMIESLNVGGNNYWNPIALKDLGDRWIDRRKTFASYNALYGEVKLFDGLRYHINVGLNYRKSDFGNFVGRGTVYNSETGASNAAIQSDLTTSWTVENLLYYEKTFAAQHNISAVAMYSAEEREYTQSRVTAVEIPADYMQFYNLGLATGDKTISQNDQRYWRRGLESYMARVAYSYANRYMITGTLRSDGASVLADGHKWNTYTALSAGWNITNEDFLKGKIAALDLLKLRAGYGQTSNQAIDPYQTQGRLGIKYYNFGTGGNSNRYGYYVNNLPNSNLGWEYSTTYNIGIDFGLLNRVSGSLEYYIQKTSDLLLELSLPYTSGVDGSYMANIGKTQNSGLELSFNAQIAKDYYGFDWDFGINIYGNRNKIVELASNVEKDEGNGWFVGSPIDVIYDYKKIGIWQTNDPTGNVQDYEGATGKTGMIKVEYTGEYDANGKPVRVIGADDRQILGSLEPDFQGGFNTRLGWKGFDLSLVAMFKSGGMLVSSLYAPSSYLNLLSGRRNNVSVDYWTPDNPTNKYPAPHLVLSGDNPKYGSTLAYFDASYLKVRTITLGYNFDRKLLQGVGISSARVYLTCQNPFVLFSPYNKESGMDPETNSPARDTSTQAVATSSTQPSRQLTVAYNTPATRNFLVGLNLSF